MNNQTPHPLLKDIDTLPSLPAIVTQVLAVASASESSANDLMKVILPDQSMCAAILKVANSAFFGFPREVSTIEKAVMVLGFDEIRNIVLGKAVFNSFRHLNNTNKVDVEFFWEHSFTCGLAAKIIAEDFHLPSSELFIAGLLHDLGKLPMLTNYAGNYTHLLKFTGPLQFNSAIEEQELFAISHDEIGMRILDKWLFPKELVYAVGYHHFPDNSPEDSKKPMVVQMADILSQMLSHPKEITPNDIKIIIQDFHPEIVTLWSNNLLTYETKLDSWHERLLISIEKDAAILEIFTS
jgi:putative nucleotidyltransferase with HDIG domain